MYLNTDFNQSYLMKNSNSVCQVGRSSWRWK